MLGQLWFFYKTVSEIVHKPCSQSRMVHGLPVSPVWFLPHSQGMQRTQYAVRWGFLSHFVLISELVRACFVLWNSEQTTRQCRPTWGPESRKVVRRNTGGTWGQKCHLSGEGEVGDCRLDGPRWNLGVC
jgi:hypothetical protein